MRKRWIVISLAAAGALAALAAPAVAAAGGGGSSRAGEQSLQIWAYFDGDTPVSGGRVHVYADGEQLRGDGIAGSNRRTFSDGTALLLLDSLPSKLRVVINGGRAGGRPVRGSLKTSVHGVGDGDVVEINPITTVADVYAHAEGGNADHARNLTERTVGIPPFLDDASLRATDRWFDGDRFQRWTLRRGSIEEGARALVRLASEPGFDRRLFRSHDGEGREALVAASPIHKGADVVLDGIIDHISTALSNGGVPGGIFFGLALKGIKTAIAGRFDASEQTELSQVQAELEAIQKRLDGLENQLKDVGFKAKVDSLLPDLSKIDNAQTKLDIALSVPGGLTTKERQELFNERVGNFVENATGLDDRSGSVADRLNKVLAVQIPGGAEPLITGFRDKVARDTRFFSNASSQEIDHFFDFYKEYEVRAATLLSELNTYSGKLDTAKQTVEKVDDDFLPQQRKLMPKYDIDPGVFIDCGPPHCDKPGEAIGRPFMWRIKPEFAPASALLRLIPGAPPPDCFAGCSWSGSGFACDKPTAPNFFNMKFGTLGRAAPDRCEDAHLVAPQTGAGFDNHLPPDLQGTGNQGANQWFIPAANMQEELITSVKGQAPIDLLKTLKVTFNQRCDPSEGDDPCRFPKYPCQTDGCDPGNALTHPIALWVRNTFDMKKYNRAGRYQGDWDSMNIYSGLYVLKPGAGSSISPNHYDRMTVADDCNLNPHPTSCKNTPARTGGFILWVRNTTATERKLYW
jgi:hypothetical protein